MAVSAIAGISGSLVLSGCNIRFASHNVEFNQEVNDCSGFATQPERENLAGMKSWGGSGAGYLVDNDATATPGRLIGGSATFTYRTGSTLAGTVRCGRQTQGTGIDGNAIAATEYVGTAAPTLTWDETA
jgi:hypothetical protein